MAWLRDDAVTGFQIGDIGADLQDDTGNFHSQTVAVIGAFQRLRVQHSGRRLQAPDGPQACQCPLLPAGQTPGAPHETAHRPMLRVVLVHRRP